MAEYFQPTGLGAALDLLGTRDMQIVAGGTDFFPALGTAWTKRDILDVSRLDELRGIDRGNAGELRIGATTTWTDIAEADFPPAFAGLQQAAREVGSVQIQNAGTIAGNLCNASPAADGIPPLLTLDATVETATRNGTRRMPLADFVTGVRRTALAPGEMVTAVWLPSPPEHAVGRFEKLGSRKYLVISITMTAAVIGLNKNGRIDFARVAVGSCAPVAQRLKGLEKALIGTRPEEMRINPKHLSPLSPISDVRADADYRMDAVQEQIRRALLNAVRTDG